MRRKLLVVLFIVLAPILLMSHNVGAVTITTPTYGQVNRSLNGAAYGTATFLTSASSYPLTVFNWSSGITQYRAAGLTVLNNLPNAVSGKYINMSASIVLEGWWGNEACSGITASITPNVNPDGSSHSYSCASIASTQYRVNINSVFTYSSNVDISSFTYNISNSANSLYACSSLTGSMIPICSSNNPFRVISVAMDYQATADPNTALLQEQIQQQQQTNKELDQVNSSLDKVNDKLAQDANKEQQAEDNISGQSPDDISDAENPATTNLIGIISSFSDAISGFSGTSCSLTLPLPEFIGGSISPNLCNLPDDVMPLVQAGSSIALIVFFVPLAWLLLRMIYNEIRSFTNANG